MSALWHVARRARPALLLPLVLASVGCSQLQPLLAPAEPAARPLPVDLKIDAPDALKPLLEKHLDLARLLSLPTEERPSAGEINRLIRAAPGQARELLQTEGYFDAQVTVRRDRAPRPAPPGTPGDAEATSTVGSPSAAMAAPDAPPTTATASADEPAAGTTPEDQTRARDRFQVVHVTVVPGDPTQVGALRVRTEGDLQTLAEAGDAAALALRGSLVATSALQPGMVFRNADWSSTKQALLARLRAAGYAAARLLESRADVDPSSRSARLLVVLDSGPLFRAGPLQISGLKHHDEATVRNLAGLEAGTALTEERLLDFQERLLLARLFQSSTVSFEPDPLAAALTPVNVRLTELPLQQLVLGVGVTSSSGARVTLEHTHRRPADLPVIAYNKLEYGQLTQKWSADFQTHPGPRFYRNLFGLEILRELSDTDVVVSQQFRLGRTQDTKRFEQFYFVELLSSRRDALDLPADAVSTGPSTATALSINAHFVRRDLDNVLLPTRGFVTALQGGLGEATSHDGDNGPFTRLYGRVTGYLPLGPWYGQARLEVGSIIKRDEVEVPDALGYRAGGDDSVRGYGYRELAPVDANGATISGNVLLTSSLELARPIVASMPTLWGAVFIDAGNAAMAWNDFKPALGYGVGVRWRSPVGPLRVDLAYGDELQKFRLHVSVGINL